MLRKIHNYFLVVSQTVSLHPFTQCVDWFAILQSTKTINKSHTIVTWYWFAACDVQEFNSQIIKPSPQLRPRLLLTLYTTSVSSCLFVLRMELLKKLLELLLIDWTMAHDSVAATQAGMKKLCFISLWNHGFFVCTKKRIFNLILYSIIQKKGKCWQSYLSWSKSVLQHEIVYIIDLNSRLSISSWF